MNIFHFFLKINWNCLSCCIVSLLRTIVKFHLMTDETDTVVELTQSWGSGLVRRRPRRRSHSLQRYQARARHKPAQMSSEHVHRYAMHTHKHTHTHHVYKCIFIYRQSDEVGHLSVSIITTKRRRCSVFPHIFAWVGMSVCGRVYGQYVCLCLVCVWNVCTYANYSNN